VPDVYFLCRLKINHDSHEFILEFGTVANNVHVHVNIHVHVYVMFIFTVIKFVRNSLSSLYTLVNIGYRMINPKFDIF
jgi:hypothetical protein